MDGLFFRIISTQCLITLFTKNVSLPLIFGTPFFNLTMRDVVACVSGFNLEEKVSVVAVFVAAVGLN